MQLVDTHAHINLAQYDEDRPRVVRRAVEANVRYILDIGTDLESSRRCVKNCETFDSVYSVVGIHPHDAVKMGSGDLDEIEKMLSHPRVVGMGEMGLDYHYDFSPRDIQKDLFYRQLRTARKYELPVVVHVREAMIDALDVIDQAGSLPWSGVFHCFSGTRDDITAVLERGFHISFTGVVTFKNFGKAGSVKAVPVQKLLLETDAPYMAPEPNRGKRNEPAYLIETARKLADLFQISTEELSSITTATAIQLFRLEH